MDRNEVLIAGGIGVAVLAIVAIKGKSTTVGATFASANPQSVAAVQSASASEIDSINKLTLAKMQTAASALVGLAQLQTSLDTVRVTSASTDHQSDNALSAVSLQAQATEYGNETASYTAVKTAGIAADVAAQMARISADAQTAASQINADAAVKENAASVGVAKDISNNQTTQARIGKSTSFGSILQGALSGAVSYFSGGGSVAKLLGGAAGGGGGGADMGNASFGSYGS